MPRRQIDVVRGRKRVGEKSYYSEIATWLKDYIGSTMQQYGNYIVDTEICATIDLSRGLRKLLRKNKISSDQLLRKADLTRGLKVDILVLVYDRAQLKGEIIISEVKRKRGLSLHDCSQLVGYCICSDTRFGLLINVDGGISDALREILAQNTALTDIIQIVNGRQTIRRIGILTWESKTRRGTFLPNGYLRSLPGLCRKIARAE